MPWFPSFLPGFGVNLAFTLLVACGLGVWVGPRLGMRRIWAMVWLACLLVPLAYTLTPTASGDLPGCDFSRLPWDSRSALLAPDTRMNIAMMIPAGAVVFLIPPGAKRLAGVGISLALPIAIEFTQMAVPWLHRGCQAADVINNQVGVMLGWCLAAGVIAAHASWRESAPIRSEASKP